MDISMVQFSIYGNLFQIRWNPIPNRGTWWWFTPMGFTPPTNLPSSSRNMSSHASTAFWKATLRPVAINNSVMAPMAYQRYTTVPFKRLKGGTPHRWMVHFRENPHSKWDFRGFHLNGKPPLIIGKSPLILWVNHL